MFSCQACINIIRGGEDGSGGQAWLPGFKTKWGRYLRQACLADTDLQAVQERDKYWDNNRQPQVMKMYVLYTVKNKFHVK